MRRLSRSLLSRCGFFEVTRPRTAIYVRRKEAQRLETAGAISVEFEEENIDIKTAERDFCDKIIAARSSPGALMIAAHICMAMMRSDGRSFRNRIEQVTILVLQVTGSSPIARTAHACWDRKGTDNSSRRSAHSGSPHRKAP